MIAVTSWGRMGNQMFQYAFGISASIKKNTNFCIDERHSEFYLHHYFHLRSYSAAKNFAWRCYTKLVKTIVLSEDQWLSPIENIKRVTKEKGNIVSEGFFQSLDYFIDYQIQIKQEFKIKPSHKINIKEVLKISNHNENIVMHIRRGDYLKFGNDELGGTNLSLPINYYLDSLKKIANIEDKNIVFISDDIEYTIEAFRSYNLGKNVYFSIKNSEIVDFQILQQADYIIISNSTFSWWAAYLGKAKKVIAPSYWLGFKIEKEYPIGVLCKDWIQVKV